MQEGLYVQALHIGLYDDEPVMIEEIHKFIEEQGLQIDINDDQYHHEIHLSDPRRIRVEDLKTVLRIPVKNNYLNFKNKSVTGFK